MEPCWLAWGKQQGTWSGLDSWSNNELLLKPAGQASVYLVYNGATDSMVSHISLYSLDFWNLVLGKTNDTYYCLWGVSGTMVRWGRWKDLSASPMSRLYTWSILLCNYWYARSFRQSFMVLHLPGCQSRRDCLGKDKAGEEEAHLIGHVQPTRTSSFTFGISERHAPAQQQMQNTSVQYIFPRTFLPISRTSEGHGEIWQIHRGQNNWVIWLFLKENLPNDRPNGNWWKIFYRPSAVIARSVTLLTALPFKRTW